MSTTSGSNFLMNLLSAVLTCQSTMEWQQIADSNTTTVDANLEMDYYNYWNGVLQKDADNISNDAAKNNTNQMSADQAKYQCDSTLAQTQQNECDTATQASQQAVSQDGTNLQNQASLGSVLNSIMSNLTSLIGHPY
jgi:hypothetical protein